MSSNFLNLVKAPPIQTQSPGMRRSNETLGLPPLDVAPLPPFGPRPFGSISVAGRIVVDVLYSSLMAAMGQMAPLVSFTSLPSGTSSQVRSYHLINRQ